MLFDSIFYLQLFIFKCCSHQLMERNFLLSNSINNPWKLDSMALNVFSNLNDSISLFLVN